MALDQQHADDTVPWAWVRMPSSTSHGTGTVVFFRMHYDSAQDGASVTFAVMDRIKAEMLHRISLSDLFKPAKRA